MGTLFELASIGTESSDFWRQYGNAPYMPEYRFAFLAYLGTVLANGAHLSWRNASIADGPTLQVGLRLVSVGCLLGLAYVAEEMLLIVTIHLGLENVLPHSDTVAWALIAGTVAFILGGSTLPAWGPRFGIPDLYEWGCRYRAYRRLYPLWLVLYRAFPAIALLPAKSTLADILTVRDLKFRLYRRVVEIRDGFLALRQYVDPTVAVHASELCRAAGLSDEETEAVVEAASLAAALEARDPLPGCRASG